MAGVSGWLEAAAGGPPKAEDQAAAGNTIIALGEALSRVEARSLAVSLQDGETLTQALGAVAPNRQAEVRRLLLAAALGTSQRKETILVLRAIEGARSHTTSMTPVWTLPPGLGALSGIGQLTAATHHLVTAAYRSVTVSTFNIQRSSALWEALKEVSSRGEVSVRIYMDADAADREPRTWSPTSVQVAQEMQGAVVLRTRRRQDGAAPRNHAQFVAVDGQILIVTSANLSASAEERNIELGLRLEDPVLTGAVESRMRELEPFLYERVHR